MGKYLGELLDLLEFDVACNCLSSTDSIRLGEPMEINSNGAPYYGIAWRLLVHFFLSGDRLCIHFLSEQWVIEENRTTGGPLFPSVLVRRPVHNTCSTNRVCKSYVIRIIVSPVVVIPRPSRRQRPQGSPSFFKSPKD